MVGQDPGVITETVRVWWEGECSFGQAEEAHPGPGVSRRG